MKGARASVLERVQPRRISTFPLHQARHSRSRHPGKSSVCEGTAKSPWVHGSVEALKHYSERQQQGCDVPQFVARIA